jgi:hypothetical protein
MQIEYLKPSIVLYKKPSLKEKGGYVLEMLNLMTSLITTFGMGTTMGTIK